MKFLVASGRAVLLAIGMDGRAPGVDGRGQDSVEALGEATGFGEGEGAGWPEGGESGIEENFCHVNVSDPRKEGGVGQGLSQRGGKRAEYLKKRRSVQGEGVGSGSRKKPGFVGGGGDLKTAEPAGIAPCKDYSLLGDEELEMGVGGGT
jgi:hypothetical protein